MELRGVPLSELRQRYGAAEDVSPSVLRALRADPRTGAREIARRHADRRARRGAERRRLTRMFRHERELRAAGFARIAGIDEVGMGPLAGPVVAAAVILPDDTELLGLRDSKQVREPDRERLDREIRAAALAVSIGVVEVGEIDRVNIYQAGLLAMRRASEQLEPGADYLLVDARRVPGVSTPQRALVGGDAIVASISAASIIAKVWRDGLMRDLDRCHPGYGFAQNAGYGTPSHLEALGRKGPSPIHRRSFAPVRAAASAREDRCLTPS